MLLILCFSWTALLDVTFNQNMKMSFALTEKEKENQKILKEKQRSKADDRKKSI